MAELGGQTLAGLLDETAERLPTAEALVEMASGRRWTFAQLRQEAEELARGLMALGLGPGEHLALWAPNSPWWVICQFAAAKAGAVLTSVDIDYTPDQLAYLLERSDSRLLLTAPGQEGTEYLAALQEICPDLPQGRCAGLPALQKVVVLADQAPTGMLTVHELAAQGQRAQPGELRRRQDLLEPGNPATLLFTSGTTGDPKGVLSSHQGVVGVSLLSAQNMGLGPDDRLVMSVPLCHMFGCVCAVLPAMAAGAAMVFPDRPLGPLSTARAVAAEGCTAIFGSPNFFLAIMEENQKANLDLSTLRTGLLGGAGCPIELMRRIVEELGVSHILVGYGQTEASSWATQTRAQDPLELRVSTVGRALPGVEVKALDPVSGQSVAPGLIGELCCRGFNMIGYYRNPAATAQAVDAAGWLHTGDLAEIDQKGYVRIKGRLKEVIKKDGRAVYPLQVEEALFSHPAVANAAVFGVPDRAWGEEIAAWVILKEGSAASGQELQKHVQAALGDFLTPRYLEFVAEFPLTAVGKVQRFKMRRAFMAARGREDE